MLGQLRLTAVTPKRAWVNGASSNRIPIPDSPNTSPIARYSNSDGSPSRTDTRTASTATTSTAATTSRPFTAITTYARTGDTGAPSYGT